MDLSMPRLDGAAATNRLKRDSRTRRIPVIVLTAYPLARGSRAARAAAADDGAATLTADWVIPCHVGGYVPPAGSYFSAAGRGTRAQVPAASSLGCVAPDVLRTAGNARASPG